MHREFDDLCLLYSAGELPESERARFEAHRAGCGQCEELVEALEAGSRAAELAAVSLPEEKVKLLADRVLDRAETEPNSAPSLVEGFRRLLGACAVFAALAVGLYISTSLGPVGRADLSSAQGLSEDIEILGAALESLGDSIELNGSGVELDSEIGALEETSAWMIEELSDA